MSERHWLSRELEGALVMFPLPLCWDAPQKVKPDHDDEGLVDGLGPGRALDPTRLVFSTTREGVSCRDCAEWLHA